MMQMFKYPQEREAAQAALMPASYRLPVRLTLYLCLTLAKQVCHADVGPANC